MLLADFQQVGALGLTIYLIVVLGISIPIIRAIVKLYKLCIKALKKYVEDKKEEVE